MLIYILRIYLGQMEVRQAAPRERKRRCSLYLRPAGAHLTEKASNKHAAEAIRGQRLRGGRAAVKIRCLLGRSRLRRKRGRLFLRLGRRSQSEPPATRLIGVTPSSFFLSLIAGKRCSAHRLWALREGDDERRRTMERLSEVDRAG